MSTIAPEHAQEIVAGWRRSIEPVHGLGNPAGELYAGGAFAEADIIQVGQLMATLANRTLCSTGNGFCCC